jgi:hypothetical protein
LVPLAILGLLVTLAQLEQQDPLVILGQQVQQGRQARLARLENLVVQRLTMSLMMEPPTPQFSEMVYSGLITQPLPLQQKFT